MPGIGTLMYPQHYEEAVYEAAEAYEVDPYLLFAIIKVESKFNPTADSNKGALGLMQIMPETGEWAANRILDEPYHKKLLLQPETNIEIGAFYFSHLLSKFEYDLNKALAAYNAGQGNVKQWLDHEVWNGSFEQLDNIPFRETREYVDRVLTNYQRYREIYTGETVEITGLAAFPQPVYP